MTITRESNLRLAADHSVSRLDDVEGVVLDLKDKHFRGLNETAVYILELLAKSKNEFLSVDKIIKSTYSLFEVDEQVLERDVLEFLTDCHDRGIIVIEDTACASVKE